MGKTVELVLKSDLCEETVEVPEELWDRFEKKAAELETPVEELFPMLIERFLKDPDVIAKVRHYIEEREPQ